MIKQKHNLNLIPNSGAQVSVHCSQYDVGARIIHFRLFNGTYAFTIPDGVTANIRGAKPDGNVFEYPMEVSNKAGVVSVALTDQMTVVAGEVICEIVLLKGGEVIGTANFKLVVEPSPIDMGQFSDSDIPAIVTLMNGGEIGQVLTWVETGAAWTWAGKGDMTKAVYDTNNDGVVDNAEMVNGHTVARDVLEDEYTNDQIDNALSDKVDKEDGKGLSTNDFTDTAKNKLNDLPTKSELDSSLANKVDKETGKGLSTNDFTDEAESKLDALPTKSELDILLSEKVDKEVGKGLSSNDYTSAEKDKLGALPTASELNTALAGKVNTETGKGFSTEDYTTAEKTKLSNLPTKTELDATFAQKKSVQAPVTSPTASGNALAFIDSVSQDAQGVLTATKKNVTVDSTPTTGSANPVQSGAVATELSNLNQALSNKVDKVAGKQLSTEDYTTAEKTKLTALPDAATLNADLANKQPLLQVTQSISGGYLYNNYYSVS